MSSSSIPWVNSQSQLSPEWQLVLSCCGLNRPHPDQIQTILQQPFNWNFFEWLTIAHQIRPLVYFNLIQYRDLLPQAQRERFQMLYQANLLENQVKTQKLLAVFKSCTESNLQIIPFKGLSLALQAYQSQTLREFSDFDIFCRKDEVIQLVNHLIEQGYEVKHGVIQANAKHQAHIDAYINAECEFSLLHPDSGVAIEPHWEVAPRRFCTPIDTKQLWERRTSLAFGQRTLPCFAPEDLLIILCLNGNKDYWKSLKSICDIAALLSTHPELDWVTVRQSAQGSGIYRILRVGIHLADQLIGCDIPERLRLDIENDETAKRLVTDIQRKLLVQINSLAPESFFFKMRWNLLVRERWRDRIQYLWVNIFVPGPADAKVLNLPKGFRVGYFVIRPFRLLWKGVSQLFLRLKGPQKKMSPHES